MKLNVVRRLRRQREGGGQDYAVMDDAAYLIEDLYGALRALVENVSRGTNEPGFVGAVGAARAAIAKAEGK